MDLRIEKTQKAIINAFLELRSEKPLNKITVTELSKKAVISKATFYLHYRDIYDLSSQLCNELISDIIAEIAHPEKIRYNPQEYVDNMLAAFASKQAMINILFPKDEKNALSLSIERHIKESIYSHFPQLKNDLKNDIALTFLIQGGFYICSDFSRDNFDAARKCTGEIVKLIYDHFLSENV